VDWKSVVNRLMELPARVMSLAAPCPQQRIRGTEAQLGKLPSQIVGLLTAFNGGELFIDATPFITIFGLSLAGDPPDRDWSVDRFTAKWRAAMNRPNDWIIGVSNYGGIYVVDENNIVREWDSAQKRWTKEFSFEEWIEFLFSEGQAYLDEE
jgi:hypothetical protein